MGQVSGGKSHGLRTAANPESVQLQISDTKKLSGQVALMVKEEHKRTKEAEKILSAKMDPSESCRGSAVSITSTSHSIWKKNLRRVQLNAASTMSEGLASLLLFVLLHMTTLDTRLSISLRELGECTGGTGEGMEQAALGERPDRSHTDSHQATAATPLRVSTICQLQCESH